LKQEKKTQVKLFEEQKKIDQQNINNFQKEKNEHEENLKTLKRFTFCSCAVCSFCSNLLTISS
jgi:hypothetical protein